MYFFSLDFFDSIFYTIAEILFDVLNTFILKHATRKCLVVDDRGNDCSNAFFTLVSLDDHNHFLGRPKPTANSPIIPKV